jgi:hypothetical protein
MATQFKVIQQSFDFAKWLLQHTQKFPKSLRFSLAVRVESRMLEALESVVVANSRRDKMPLLSRADEALESLRILVRLSHEMRVLPLNSYEYASRELDEIGRLLGGWIRQQRRPPG